MPMNLNKSWDRNRMLSIFARLILGGVFIYASFDKILHPASFAEAVYRYQILPDGLINLTAIVLPWLELIVGGFLILGFWMPGTVLMSNLLLMTFMGALLFNMGRGLDIGCGCFSTASESSMAIRAILRDSFFLILAVFLLYGTFFSKDKTN
jgi:uncharacterized membrane protein YphA (DoxX/SURF4 family)